MKKFMAACLLLCSLTNASFAQENNLRPQAIGVSFLLNDFKTAQSIRNTSLERTLSENQWAKLREMYPGVAISYFKGLKKHLDFAGTVAFSSVKYPLPGKTGPTPQGFLMEADASVNAKLFSEAYWFTPYISAGVGASKFKDYYGAFIPVGLGFKVNFFDEASLFFNTSYRVPVSPETVNYHLTYSLGVTGIIGKKD